MIKSWKWYILAGLVLVSCAVENDASMQEDALVLDSDKRVTVTLSVIADSQDFGTKAVDDKGKLENMYVAVFGNSGYLKEYVKADFVEAGVYKYKVTQKINGETITIDREGKRYAFKATLAISDSPRRIHILGNAPSTLPFGYDSAVLPSRLCENGKEAYWQMILMPNGIRAKKENGVYVDEEGNPIPEGGKGYVPDLDTESRFAEIPLIRNRAKIVVSAEENSNFTLKSFAVINVPKCGTYVPYSGKTGFVSEYEYQDDNKETQVIRGYQNMGFNDLEEMGYPANLPIGNDGFDDNIPDESMFIDPSSSDGRVADNEPDAAVYLYERPIPSEKMPPTYVIVYGTYNNPEDPDNNCDCFYKVDLMETKMVESDYVSSYYPIYRNFKYQIKIQKIASRGQKTPQEAAVSAGSADVSADINTGGLSDISDGIGRLHITPWMAYTFTTERDKNNPVDELRVNFAISGVPDLEPDCVEVKVLPQVDGGEDIIYQVPTDDQENPEPYLSDPIKEGDEIGWRRIRFCTVRPGLTTRSQTIRIIGKHTYGRIYRDVVISIQQTQDMWVKCEKSVVPPSAGSSQTISFGIPEGLNKSMFPLDFTIEATDLTLTPDNSYDNNNLPVVSGYSISGGNGPNKDGGKIAFQFQRTVTWDEYRNHLEVYEDDFRRRWIVVPCHFKTNCDASATTVWVYNEYFKSDKAFDSFHNFEYKTFRNLSFPGCIPCEEDKSVEFRFEPVVDSYGEYPEIQVVLRGLVADSSFMEQIELGTYVFTPTYEMLEDDGTIKLSLITTTSDGDISVELSSEEFVPAILTPYRFNKGKQERSYGFLDGLKRGSIWSNVAYGRVQSAKQDGTIDGRTLVFAYFDDPMSPAAKVYFQDSKGKDITTSKNSNLSGIRAASSDYASPYTPPSTSSYYHELNFTTEGNMSNDVIEFYMSSPGYVTEHIVANRLGGKTRLHSMDMNASKINSWFVEATESSCPKILSQVADNSTDHSYFEILLEPLNGAPVPYTTSSNGLVLGKEKESGVVRGGSYKLTVRSGNVDVPFTMDPNCKNQRFYMSRFTFAKGYLPDNVVPTQGMYYLYPGSDNIYTWSAYDDPETEYTESKIKIDDPDKYSKSIIIDVGTDHSVIINNIYYKAISFYALPN